MPLPRGDMSDHPMVHINSEKRTQKDCKYCQIHKIKSKSGLRLKTLYKCGKCDVALCSAQHTERHCFVMFHNEFIFGSSQMYWPSHYMTTLIFYRKYFHLDLRGKRRNLYFFTVFRDCILLKWINAVLPQELTFCYFLFFLSFLRIFQ